jgi:hypothetical protein
MATILQQKTLSGMGEMIFLNIAHERHQKKEFFAAEPLAWKHAGTH